MEKTKHDTDDSRGQGNVFQINDGPGADTPQTDRKKKQKSEGKVFQINGDADKVPADNDDNENS